MSLLINGMEMPTDRSRWVVIYPDGKVEYSDKTDEWETLDKGAVPVPPHGRLIEKNAVFELIRSLPNVDRQLSVEFMKALYELPTIIPEEEGE